MSQISVDTHRTFIGLFLSGINQSACCVADRLGHWAFLHGWPETWGLVYSDAPHGLWFHLLIALGAPNLSIVSSSVNGEDVSATLDSGSTQSAGERILTSEDTRIDQKATCIQATIIQHGDERYNNRHNNVRIGEQDPLCKYAIDRIDQHLFRFSAET